MVFYAKVSSNMIQKVAGNVGLSEMDCFEKCLLASKHFEAMYNS